MEPITFALKAVFFNRNTRVREGRYSRFNYGKLITSRKKKWSKSIKNIRLCKSGWHVVLPSQITTEYSQSVNHFLKSGNEVWLVACRGNNKTEDGGPRDKAVFGQIKFLKRIVSTKAFDYEYVNRGWIKHPEQMADLFNKAVEEVLADPAKFGL